MFKLLKIVKEEDPRRPISTRSWRRRIPGAAGGRSVIDHAASTQSVIFNKENYEHIYVRLEKINICLSIYIRRLLWMTAPADTLTSLSSTESSTMEAAMAAVE